MSKSSVKDEDEYSILLITYLTAMLQFKKNVLKWSLKKNIKWKGVLMMTQNVKMNVDNQSNKCGANVYYKGSNKCGANDYYKGSKYSTHIG